MKSLNMLRAYANIRSGFHAGRADYSAMLAAFLLK